MAWNCGQKGQDFRSSKQESLDLAVKEFTLHSSGMGMGFTVFFLFLHSILQETSLYEYKIHGVMEDLDPEICAQVYVDTEYRKQWDSYAMGKAF